VLPHRDLSERDPLVSSGTGTSRALQSAKNQAWDPAKEASAVAVGSPTCSNFFRHRQFDWGTSISFLDNFQKVFFPHCKWKFITLVLQENGLNFTGLTLAAVGTKDVYMMNT